MRGVLLFAAVAGLWFQPANAAVALVQVTSDFNQNPLKLFDPQLGTLRKVTLNADVSKFRGWAFQPNNGATGDTIDWSVSDRYAVRGWGLSSKLFFPLTGNGSFNITFDTNGYAQAGSNMKVTGTQSFIFDPSLFIDPGSHDEVYYFGDDLGFRNSSGTTISARNGSTIIDLRGACGGGDNRDSEDFCGKSDFTLTYFYTPAPEGVPEPATWAMMLLGFLGVGAAMRRRLRRAAALA